MAKGSTAIDGSLSGLVRAASSSAAPSSPMVWYRFEASFSRQRFTTLANGEWPSGAGSSRSTALSRSAALSPEKAFVGRRRS